MESDVDLPSRVLDFAMAFVPLVALAGTAVVLERRFPWRAGRRLDGLHWLQSAVLMLLGNILARLILPLSVFSAGIYAASQGIGLFNRIEAPLWLVFPLSLLLLDLVDYLRHRLLHISQTLWRAHRVHHSDEEIDASTALRFHPFEALITAACHVGIVLLVGVPPEAAVAFVFIALFFDVWEHANMHTPRFFRHLELVLITPSMHRFHHGADGVQMSKNFGVIFSIWDRAFGTYRSSAELQMDTRFGLGSSNRQSFETLRDLLFDPLRKG